MRWWRAVLLGLLTVSQGQLSTAAPPFEQARSFAFLQERGGVAITSVERKNGGWRLPVQCNVSGIKTITVTPSVIHSSLAWSKTVARIEQKTIYLQVYTAMQGNRAPSAVCGPAKLQRARPGTYQVYYADPPLEGEEDRDAPPAESLHMLGTVTIH